MKMAWLHFNGKDADIGSPISSVAPHHEGERREQGEARAVDPIAARAGVSRRLRSFCECLDQSAGACIRSDEITSPAAFAARPALTMSTTWTGSTSMTPGWRTSSQSK